MKSIALARRQHRLSQRRLASMAGISYKTLQLMEAGRTDQRLSSIEKIASALGYPTHLLTQAVESIFTEPIDSISMISYSISKKKTWKIKLFNFVDRFRNTGDKKMIMHPPHPSLSEKMKALLASTVETLCDEMKIKIPPWCSSIGPLKLPYFVAWVENLKAMAIVESPIHFRKRNIFVLSNFLERV